MAVEEVLKSKTLYKMLLYLLKVNTNDISFGNFSKYNYILL